jgi:hypothetical protein
MPTSADGQQPQQQVPMSRSTPNLQQLVNSLYLRDDPAWGVPAVLAAGHNTHQQHHSPLQQLQPAAPSRSESVTSLPASSSSGLSSWGSIQDASKAGEFHFRGCSRLLNAAEMRIMRVIRIYNQFRFEFGTNSAFVLVL